MRHIFSNAFPWPLSYSNPKTADSPDDKPVMKQKRQKNGSPIITVGFFPDGFFQPISSSPSFHSSVFVVAGVGGAVVALIIILLACYACRKKKKPTDRSRKFGKAKRQPRVQLGPPPAAQMRTEQLTEEEPIEHGRFGQRTGSFVVEQQQSPTIDKRPVRAKRTLESIGRQSSSVSSTASTDGKRVSTLPRMSTIMDTVDRRTSSSEFNPLGPRPASMIDADESDEVFDETDNMSLVMSLRHSAGVLPDEDDSNAPLGRLQFRLEYCYDRNSIRLHLIRAEDLPAKDLRGTSDPFLKVYLIDLRQMTPDGQVRLGKAWRTRTHQQTLNPELDEYHDFECPTIAAARHLGLLMHIYDYDRFSRNDIIGHVWLPLKGVDLSDIPTIWKAIQPGKKIRAEEVRLAKLRKEDKKFILIPVLHR